MSSTLVSKSHELNEHNDSNGFSLSTLTDVCNKATMKLPSGEHQCSRHCNNTLTRCPIFNLS